MRARLRKAAHQAEHRNPGWARFVSHIERVGLSLDRALSETVADSSCKLKLRELAARLLRNVAGDPSAFVPLLTEFIAAGDVKNPELRSVTRSMRYGGGRLGGPEFEILYSILRSGTSEQRHLVVDQAAFFTDSHDRCKVRHALIEVLEDRAGPAEVRGWAAERLHLHISQEAVRACIRAAEDPSPEVRLWAVYTLGCAASKYGVPHPLYHDVAAPVLERALGDMAMCRDGGRSAAKLRPSCNGFTEGLMKTPAYRLRFKLF